MKQYNQPHNFTEWYYIKYTVKGVLKEFWADNEEEYEERLAWIQRHIGDHKLIDYRPPRKWPDDFRNFGIKVKF